MSKEGPKGPKVAKGSAGQMGRMGPVGPKRPVKPVEPVKRYTPSKKIAMDMDTDLNIEIRPAEIGDYPIIARAVCMAIGEETAKRYCGDNCLEALEKIARMEGTQYSYRNALVATANGVPAGAIVGYDGGQLHRLRERTLSVVRRYNPQVAAVEDETGEGEFYLDSIGILPGFRGCGVGRKLLTAMRERAIAAGHGCVGLLVDCENPRAEQLYVAIGFVPVGTRRFFGHTMRHLQWRP